MIPSLLLCSSCVGLFFLLLALAVGRKELISALPVDKVMQPGYAFVAAPLAVFAMEHLLAANSLIELVPVWMPERVFWVYFVGVALLAAALSLSLRWHLDWSAPALAVMFFIFVATVQLPGIVQLPRERLFWTLTLRETAFAGGALALAADALRKNVTERRSRGILTAGRLCIAIPAMVFGVEHMMFPHFAPGVPLNKLSPDWVPVPVLWSFLTGLILILAGLAMLLNKRVRLATMSVGITMTLITLFLYLPIFLGELKTPLGMEGLNYIGDTLLFGGTVLLLGLSESRRTSGPVRTQ